MAKRTPEIPIPQPSADMIRRREAEESALREEARQLRREYLASLDPRQRDDLTYQTERTRPPGEVAMQ